MSAEPICFACAAIKRRPALSLDDRWRLCLHCVCGGVTPADFGTMRAALNERDAIEAKRGQS